MVKTSGEFSLAAGAVLVSAVLHVVVIVVSGGGYVVPMLAGAVGWFVIGAGLQRGLRWLAHLAFLLAMIGGVVAMAYAMGAFGLTALAFWGIVAADCAAAVLLFVALWRGPQLVE